MRSVADADTYNFKGLNYCNYYTMNQYLLLSTIATRETRGERANGMCKVNDQCYFAASNYDNAIYMLADL